MDRSRRAVLAILLATPWIVTIGCAEDNEKNFAKTPGSAPPDAPQTAEEYEERYNSKKKKRSDI